MNNRKLTINVLPDDKMWGRHSSQQGQLTGLGNSKVTSLNVTPSKKKKEINY